MVVGFGGLIDGVGTRLPQPPVGSEHSKPRRLPLAARDHDTETPSRYAADAVLHGFVGGVRGESVGKKVEEVDNGENG